MALSEKTIEKLKLVKAAILAEPRLYNQNLPPDRADCGTPACIAGWVAWVDNPSHEKYLLALRPFESSARLMKNSLEITQDQTNYLFGGPWPDRFMAAWDRPGTKKAAEAAAGFIDHFIATDGEVPK